jgi:16S rRNA (uracil1498-N3)-methyltransferase
MPPRTDLTLQRLFIDLPMQGGRILPLDRQQANYLLNVLRMREGAELLVFNGNDGEWRAVLSDVQKKSAVLTVTTQTRPQTRPGTIWLAFAPLKTARLDYMVQKAVEMGASRLIPVLTHRTQVSRLKTDRMRANVIEAAEQCGVLSIPDVAAEVKLASFLPILEPSSTVLFCDETAGVSDPVKALMEISQTGSKPATPVVILIGPEGGFDEEERQMILARKPCIALALGPRILRADTAAVAALAAVQIALGDWR